MENMSMTYSQQAALHQLPIQRIEYLTKNRIQSADSFLENNPQVNNLIDGSIVRLSDQISSGIPQEVLVVLKDAATVGSSLLLEHYRRIMTNPDIIRILNEKELQLEYHAITTGSAFTAAQEEGLIRKGFEPSKEDFDKVHSIEAMGLATYLMGERTPAAQEDSVVKVFALEGAFAPALVQLLAGEFSNLNVVGAVPSLEAQQRIAPVRDAILAVKIDPTPENVAVLNTVLKENKTSFGHKGPVTLEEVQDLPLQAPSRSIWERRNATNELLANWYQSRGIDRVTVEWLEDHPNARARLYGSMMRATFRGEVYKGVKFKNWAVGYVHYDEEKQNVFPEDFRYIEANLSPIAAVYSTL